MSSTMNSLDVSYNLVAKEEIPAALEIELAGKEYSSC